MGAQPAERLHKRTCGRNGLGVKARSRADGLAFEQREDAALRRGAAAGCCGFSEAAKAKSKRKRGCPVFAGCSLRSACTSGPAGREQRAFAGRSCGPLRFRSEPQIHNSRFKIMKSGYSLRSARLRHKELRASAAGRLRPARPLQGRFPSEASPPPGGGCGLLQPLQGCN